MESNQVISRKVVIVETNYVDDIIEHLRKARNSQDEHEVDACIEHARDQLINIRNERVFEVGVTYHPTAEQGD